MNSKRSTSKQQITTQADPLAEVVTIGELERLAGISRQGTFSESFHFWHGLNVELFGFGKGPAEGDKLLRIGGQRLRGLIMARVNRGELCLIGGAA
jgi:hypothetical protein